MKREFLKKVIIIGITTLITTNLSYVSASAKWISDSKNDWNWIEDGVKATGWKKINNKWYHFDDDGTMDTGWLKYNEKWYSLSDDGSMDIGWKKINNKWYHFDSDGKMSIGWVNDGDTYYYTNANGEMQTGTLEIAGVTYTFSDSGTMLSSTKSNTEMQNEVTDAKSDSNLRIAYVATNDDVLNIRSEATISSDILGTLQKGAEIKIIDGEKNGFYPLMTNGKKGWVSSMWVSFKKTETPVMSNGTSISDSMPVVSPSVENKYEKVSNNSSLETVRDTAPSLNDKHYYSDDNLFYKVKLSPPFYSGGKQIKGNCTWYSWGRAWELTGTKPTDAGFVGNAYEWWEANKKSGKYQYGSEPRVGAIAVWKSNLPNSGGDGHVAIVEKIDNGKIYISESTWNGVNFRYREIYETSYLYGYIYLDKPNY